MAQEKWMQGVAKGIEKRGTKGALTRQASAAGKSITEFCKGSHGAKTGRRCGLAKAFRGARKRGRGGSR